MLTRRRFHLQGLGLGALAAWPAWAQSGYPSKTIRIIVPFAAGGGPDVQTRKMALKLGEVLGSGRVVVENIVGAGGILAAQNAARMAPDGYTVLLGASTHVTQKAMSPDVKFDPVKDFVHITRVTSGPQVLVVVADSPIKTVDDLLAAARRDPGKLFYASGGVGSAAHLAGAAMAVFTKINVIHVPYKGSVEIVPSLYSGLTQFAFPVASTAIPQIQAGKARALAVTGATRLPALAQVPTLKEVLGTDDLVIESWGGIWAPAGTPTDVVGILFQALARTYADPGVRADVEASGSSVALSQSPAEFTRFIESETVKFQRLVKAANLSVN